VRFYSTTGSKDAGQCEKETRWSQHYAGEVPEIMYLGRVIVRSSGQ
jgi:hypothetical protein